jgi:hypothetical protein
MASTRALRLTTSLCAAAIASWAAPAGADEPDEPDAMDAEPAVPSPDAPDGSDACGCSCGWGCPDADAPLVRNPRLVREQQEALALGWTFLGVGHGIAIAHSFTASTMRDRFAGLIPIGGAVWSVWQNRDSPPWTAALMFSAWSQAVGALVLVLVGCAPDDELARVPPVHRIGGASLSLRF